jgi:ADP-ribosylglycohydrolase
MQELQWVRLDAEALETERLQLEQEGKSVGETAAEFDRLLGADLNDPVVQQEAEALLDRCRGLPSSAGFRYAEPDDLAEIRSLRPDPSLVVPPAAMPLDALAARMEGAWLGRCAGCLLGKPVEGWPQRRITEFLKHTGNRPLHRYMRRAEASGEFVAANGGDTAFAGAFVDTVSGMPEDDDLNYTVAALALLEKHGRDFTSLDVLQFWADHLDIRHTFTAERKALANFGAGFTPPLTALHRNPYREWIGAQIRADQWGWAVPGNPEAAAELAWRDARVSHVKNGIYGAMWVAAMSAAAFSLSIPSEIVAAGLQQVPRTSRLYDIVNDLFEWEEVGVDYDTAVYRLHELWLESRPHDWCHVLPNALIVAAALIWGEGDFDRSICMAVQAGFDTDCNGATVGSILGAMLGRGAVGTAWTSPLNNTLETGVKGFERCSISGLAARSVQAAAIRI